jgi:hypothetical protein
MYGTLAHEIFKELPEDAPLEDNVVSAEVRATYKANPGRFAKSLQQQFARVHDKANFVVSSPLTHIQFEKELLHAQEDTCSSWRRAETRRPAEQPHRYMRDFVNAILAEILAKKIKLAFPHWDELDGFWREFPNYNPIGISNSTGGVDHAAAAASLFRKKADSGDTSGIENGPETQFLSSSRAASSALSVGGDEVDQLAEDEDDEPKVCQLPN